MPKRTKEEIAAETTYKIERNTRIDYMKEAPMKKEIYNLEGIEIEVEKYDKNDKDAERRRLAYCFRMIREKSGMSRTIFLCGWACLIVLCRNGNLTGERCRSMFYV